MADYDRLKCDACAGLNVMDLGADLKDFADSLVANDPACGGNVSRSRTPDIARIRIRGHEMHVRTAHARVNHFYPDFVRTECRQLSVLHRYPGVFVSLVRPRIGNAL